jgi:hypothetical protein
MEMMIYAIVKLLKANKTTLSCGLTERITRMTRSFNDFLNRKHAEYADKLEED